MKSIKNKKTERRRRIHKKVRTRISGTAKVPRLSVFRSSQYIYAQLIDDIAGKTLAAVSDMKEKGSGVKRARAVGLALAKAAAEKKIKETVFDRGGFAYAGRVKALAEGAREGGLVF